MRDFHISYCFIEDDINEQTDGAPMGSPLPSVLADLYIEFFEQMAINNEHKPTLQ